MKILLKEVSIWDFSWEIYDTHTKMEKPLDYDEFAQKLCKKYNLTAKNLK